MKLMISVRAKMIKQDKQMLNKIKMKQVQQIEKENLFFPKQMA